jgi:hypothetical protein
VVDIYSGRIPEVSEVEGASIGGGSAVAVEDLGAALNIHVMAPDKETAQQLVKEQYEKYVTMPISKLNNEYGRHQEQRQ